MSTGSALNMDGLEDSIANLHRVLWSRLIDPETGAMLDYAGVGAPVEIPSPEDCRARCPNALSWWTPIENGAFFGGLYLDALCGLWLATGNPATREEARTIVRGLLRLQDVGVRRGFIARGVSTDGRTHYPLGSSDQTFPWLYGLWKYVRSGIPGEAERADLVKRMDTVVREVVALGWRMPAEAPYEHAGEWLKDGFREISRAICACRIMEELTGDGWWRERLDEVMSHTFDDGRGVPEVLLDFESEMPFYFTWINAVSVAGIRDLYRLEPEGEQRDLYRECLRRAGAAAASYVSRWREFVPGQTYTADWRCFCHLEGPQETVSQAGGLASEQHKVWTAACPAVFAEKRYVMYPLFGAWIVLMSEDEELIESTLPELLDALRSLDWDGLHYSGACFVGENLYAELLARHARQ